jgi:hypothetical protein
MAPETLFLLACTVSEQQNANKQQKDVVLFKNPKKFCCWQ